MFSLSRNTLHIDQDTWSEIVTYATSGSLFPNSIDHGEDHWRAVAAQGLRLSGICNLGQKGRTAGALFGLFHDCRRINDGDDPEHGERGAEALASCDALRALDRGLRDRLIRSMTLHDRGQTTDDLLIGLGWDADRSVLGRVGITPDQRFFSCIPEPQFDDFIHAGKQATRTPPRWDDIWRLAFAGA